MNFNTIDFNTINLVLMGVALFFVATGLFFGLIRGFKKATFRVLWLVFTALLLFFITPFFVSFILNLNIGFINWNYDGTKIVTLNQFVTLMLSDNEMLSDIASNPELQAVLIKLIGLIINVFLFVLLFWILKILLYPVFVIVSAIFIKKRNDKGEKIKKYRLGGMLVGGITGLFIGSITLMPIANTINLAKQVELATKDISENETGIIESQMGSNLSDFITGYENSNANMLYKYSGFAALSGALYRGLSTAQINDVTVNLEDNITNALQAYGLILDIEFDGITELSKEEFDALLGKLIVLVEKVEDVTLLDALSKSAMPYIANKIVNDPNFVINLNGIDDPILKSNLSDAVLALRDLSLAHVFSDAKSVLTLARNLNNDNIFVPSLAVFNNDAISMTEKSEVLLNIVTEAHVASITTTITDLKLLSFVLPSALNYAIEFMEQDSSIGVILEEDMTVVKTAITDIVKTLYKIATTIDFGSTYYVTTQTIPYVGRLADILISVLQPTGEAFDQAIETVNEMLSTELTKLQPTMPFITNEVVNTAQNIVSNIKTIEQFETEFTILSTVLNSAIDVFEDINSNVFPNLEAIGSILDTLNTTHLFKNQINSLFKAFANYALAELPAEFDKFTSILQGALNNIDSDIVWATELTAYNNIIDYVLSIDLEESDFIAEITTVANLQLLGSILDDLKETKLLGNQVNKLVATLISFTQDGTEELSEEMQDLINPFLAQIETNILNAPEEMSYETELVYFADIFSLVNALDSSTGMQELGAIIDGLSSSYLIPRSLINTLIPNFIDTMTEGSDSIPTSIVNCIKNSIPQIVSFEQEFAELDAFMTSFDFNDIQISDIGTILDSFEGVLLKAIRQEIVNLAFDAAIDSLTDQGMIDTINNLVKANFNDALINGETYAALFGEIENIASVLEDIQSLTEGNAHDFNAGALGSSFNALKNLSIYGEAETAQNVSDILNNFIGDLEDSKSELDSDSPTYELQLEFIENKITDLQTINSDILTNTQGNDYAVIFEDIYSTLNRLA